MANRFDPRMTATPLPTTTGRGAAAYEAGLCSHMLSVYSYMGFGVLNRSGFPGGHLV